MTATPTIPAERRAQPAGRGPRPRPPLRVVPDGYRTPQARRRRARVRVGVGLLAAVGLLFGLVGIHVVLTEGQFRLQHLQTQANDAQAQYVRLRLQVAQLESPARIVADAQERLGMVAPSALTYLMPPASTAATTPSTTAASPSSRASASAAQPRTDHPTDPTQEWANAKPALANNP
jgi:cell division protein FtsL